MFSKGLLYRVIKNRVNFLFISFPTDKMSKQSKLQAFADDKINVNDKVDHIFGRKKKT